MVNKQRVRKACKFAKSQSPLFWYGMCKKYSFVYVIFILKGHGVTVLKM